MTYPPPQGRGTPVQGQYPTQTGPVEGDGGQRPAPRPDAARYPETPPHPGAAPSRQAPPHPGSSQAPYPAPPPPHVRAPHYQTPHYPVSPQQSGQLPGWDSPFVHMQTSRSTPNRLLIAGIAAGVVAIVALGAVLLVALSSAVADSSSNVATTTAAPSDTGETAPDGPGQQGQGQQGQGDDDPSGASADATQTAAVRAAMQRYIDAYNSRDLNQIKAATCTGLRNQVRAPRAPGTVVLDNVSGVQVSGDVAQSLVETHLTDGSQTSRTTTDKASFSNEQGTWYFCPNAQPSYST